MRTRATPGEGEQQHGRYLFLGAGMSPKYVTNRRCV
jgi:hypothetical protein